MRRMVPTVLMCVLACVPVFAQTLGTITGEVKDASGAIIPQSLSRRRTTRRSDPRRTARGRRVQFPAMQPGPTTVKAELGASTQ